MSRGRARRGRACSSSRWGEGGLFTADDVRAAVKPRAYYCPNTSLVVVENTHNRAGGRVFPQTGRRGAFVKPLRQRERPARATSMAPACGMQPPLEGCVRA